MLWPTSFSALLLLQGVSAIPAPQQVQQRSDANFAVKNTKSFAPASDLKPAEKVVPLKKAGSIPKGSKALLRDVLASSTTPLKAAEEGAGYAIDVNLGNETFDVIFDTGSSDLWVAQSDVRCVDVNQNPQPVAACGFGPTFTGTFDEGAVANENFNISYGDGEFLTGTLGYEAVSVAGVTVDHQEFALVDYAYWNGDNVTSGLIGFAYSSLTSAYEGTDPSADDANTTSVHYTNYIDAAINQGKIAPMFSHVLERGPNGGSGQLALGGLPDIDFDQDFASTPLQIIELTPHPIEQKNYSYYTIIPDGFLLSADVDTYYGYQHVGESPATQFPVIIDSGTTLVYLPAQVAEDVNSLFDPPAIYIEEEGVFETLCDATPPTFAIRIGGKDFYISGQELLLTGELGEDPSTGLCVTGIQAGAQPYILGDVFLKNVVAVYDIGASEMRFAAHENY